MAVRFDADGEDYNSTSLGLTGFPLTVTCWVKLSADRNAFSTGWCLDNGTTTNAVAFQSDSSGTFMRTLWEPQSNTTDAGTFAVGTWYKTAFTADTSTATQYAAAAGSSLAQTQNWPVTNPPSGLSRIRLGESVWASEWLNGCIANFKLYSAVLTQVELEQELQFYQPARTTNLVRWHPLVAAGTVDHSGNGFTLSGGSGVATEDGPPIRWGTRRQPRIQLTPQVPSVDAGKDVFGTAGFEFSIQAVESGLSITNRSWTVISGPAEVATEIGTTSLLSWFPATPGVYELEYRVTNPAGQAYDTVFATVTATGTVVNSASAVGASNTVTCSKPTGVTAGDVMLAVQSGDFNDFDLMTSPNAWQPLFEYDVGFDSLHVKGWTLTAGASEPASYDFTQGTGSASAITIVAMRGVVEAGVRHEITPDDSTGATRTCPTVEGVVPGSILLCGAMADPGVARSWTPPTGMTEQADVQSSTGTTQSVASLLDPGDPTGAKSFTLSGVTTAPGGIQWSAVFPMPPDPQRRGANKSMFTVVRTS
jgi:hypothetical protein